MIVILRKNCSAVYGNKKFVDIIKDSNSTDTDDISLLRKKFATSKLAKAIWNCNIRCFISKSLRSELKLLSDIMKNKKNLLGDTNCSFNLPHPRFLCLGRLFYRSSWRLLVELKIFLACKMARRNYVKNSKIFHKSYKRK